MQHLAILLVMLGFLGFGLASKRVERSMVTGPLLFMLFGYVVGPVTGWVVLDIGNDAIHWLAEFTLILVLFSDAARMDLSTLRRDHLLPLRMLALGMPLTILASAAFALLVFGTGEGGIGVWEAVLLAAILAPTDAALGQAVVSNPAVPVRIRQALNVESGLNDGIALPVVLIAAALASASNTHLSAEHWIWFGALQVTVGPLAGVAMGWVSAKLVLWAHRTDWMTESAEGIVALGVAFASFALAEAIHGNGFIAAFVGGLAFGHALKRRCAYLYEFAETEGQLLTLATFFVVGMVMAPVALAHATWLHLVYGLAALTVLRMVPVALSLLGTKIAPVTFVFLGWFGPRGLASVLFVLLVLEESELSDKDSLFAAVIITVMLSVVLHGITASPAARRYGAMAAGMGDCTENEPMRHEAPSD